MVPQWAMPFFYESCPRYEPHRIEGHRPKESLEPDIMGCRQPWIFPQIRALFHELGEAHNDKRC